MPYQTPQPPPLSPALDLARSRARYATDPELVSLPRSKGQGRAFTLLVLALGVVAAVGMVVALARDAGYALRGGGPFPLGELGSVGPASLAEHENRAVVADGLLGVVGALRYERPLREDTFRVLPVLGRFDLWVEVRVPAGKESGRWEPPRSFTGRLERLDKVGPTHRGLRDAIEQATHTRVPSDAWLIVDGDDPPQARWVLVLVMVFLTCAVCNSVAIVRVVRKVGS